MIIASSPEVVDARLRERRRRAPKPNSRIGGWRLLGETPDLGSPATACVADLIEARDSRVAIAAKSDQIILPKLLICRRLPFCIGHVRDCPDVKDVTHPLWLRPPLKMVRVLA
ncbi:MAG TPA: hypothetical protein VJN44_16815 [Roseateles sp.]|nr:hypothetical protein [Roseateles sp.]